MITKNWFVVGHDLHINMVFVGSILEKYTNLKKQKNQYQQVIVHVQVKIMDKLGWGQINSSGQFFTWKSIYKFGSPILYYEKELMKPGLNLEKKYSCLPIVLVLLIAHFI